MPTRRTFIKQTSLFTAGLLTNPEAWMPKKRPIGVQLYTLRVEMGKDPKGTLKQVAGLGYKQVETFGYSAGKWFGLSVSDLAATLKEHGLTSPSGHTFPGSMFLKAGWEDGWKTAVQDAKALGQEFIVIPWLEPEFRTKADNYKRIAEGLNKAGALCKDAGIKLAYHNHDFEFVPVEGQSGFNTLAKTTDPELVCFELDLYWAVKAGHDPLQLFATHPGRFPLWHVKDMDKTDKKFFTEVGNGSINFAAIFNKAGQSGMKYFFVEQDVCPGPPLESIRKSIAYLQQHIIK
jgi:sugar phosphate isomerase/epimerase